MAYNLHAFIHRCERDALPQQCRITKYFVSDRQKAEDASASRKHVMPQEIPSQMSGQATVTSFCRSTLEHESFCW